MTSLHRQPRRQLRRPTAVAALAAIALLGLVACSGGSKEVSGESTTTSSVALSTTSSVDTSTTLVAATAPASTVAPTTVAPTTAAPTTAPPTTATPGGFPLYEGVLWPTVPADRTDPVPASGTLPNGVYWAAYSGGEELTPAITVYEAYFGPLCISTAEEFGDECLNDIFVAPDPVRDLDDLPFADDVYLTVSDVATKQSHRVTPAELVQIRSGSPSVEAPGGYTFVPFAFLLTVADGEIVGFEQVWTP